MGSPYFFLALLALYGDLVKRFAPPVIALGIVYASAIYILVMIVVHDRGRTRKIVEWDAQLVNVFVFTLIITYIFQFVTSFSASIFEGLSHLFYIVVPLSYIIVVQRYWPQFSLYKLATLFFWMMIPINTVGLIQFAIQPDFLLSTEYSGILGGVIERNLFHSGFFERYPSLFASADRYSAMALMQFYFSCVLLTAEGSTARRTHLWVMFNIFSSLVALGIAGARSRILIVLSVIVLIVLSQAVRAIAFPKGDMRSRAHGLRFAFLGTFGLALGILLIALAESEEYPILLFLQQTFREGDIQVRLLEALQLAWIPHDVSLFGEGLGTIGTGGRPGEFGIHSIWLESGLLWGSLILIGFLGIIAILTSLAFRSALKGESVQLVVRCVPVLLLLFGLLAGLSSVFELSTGILMACAIAVAVRRSNLIRQSASMSNNKIRSPNLMRAAGSS